MTNKKLQPVNFEKTSRETMMVLYRSPDKAVVTEEKSFEAKTFPTFNKSTADNFEIILAKI